MVKLMYHVYPIASSMAKLKWYFFFLKIIYPFGSGEAAVIPVLSDVLSVELLSREY